MFNRTFLHETEYRGDSSMEKIANAKITICGVGAIGSNLADSFVRQGFQNLRIVDMDRVEQHNVGNQVYEMSDVGGRKVEVLRNRLFRTCEVEVEAISKRLDAGNARKLLKGSDLVIDAFDNSESRQAVQDFCRSNKMECVHIGLFEDYGEVVWDGQYSVPQDVDGDVCEYPLARNLVGLTVAVAGELVVRFVMSGQQASYTLTLKDLSICKNVEAVSLG